MSVMWPVALLPCHRQAQFLILTYESHSRSHNAMRNLAVIYIALLIQHFAYCKDAPYSIQRVAKQAVDKYFDDDYPAAIRDFESALVHYRMFKSIDATCGVRCNSPNISKEIGMSFTGFDELYAFGNLIAQANCFKICKEEHPFVKKNIERPRADYVRDFESRMTYNYLQFAYWKTGHIDKAIQAAHTYLQANPQDQQMKDNMEYYKDLWTSEKPLIDLEAKPYQGFFPKAVKLYEAGKYAEAIENFESTLSDYFIVLDECKASCHIEKDPETFHGFVIAVAFRYKPVYECIIGCEKKLRPLVDEYFVDDLVPRTYSYLQFAYYQLKKYSKAVPAAASALLMDEGDELAISNMQYYSGSATELGLKETDFLPRTEAQKYAQTKNEEAESFKMLEQITDYQDEDEVQENEPDTLKDHLVQEISRQVAMAISEGGLGGME